MNENKTTIYFQNNEPSKKNEGDLLIKNFGANTEVLECKKGEWKEAFPKNEKA